MTFGCGAAVSLPLAGDLAGDFPPGDEADGLEGPAMADDVDAVFW